MKIVAKLCNASESINHKPPCGRTIAMALAFFFVFLAFASPAVAQIQRSDFAGNGVPIKVTNFNNASGGVYTLDLHTKQMKVNNSVAANISTARAGGLQ